VHQPAASFANAGTDQHQEGKLYSLGVVADQQPEVRLCKIGE
jgi:hypothetical protein